MKKILLSVIALFAAVSMYAEPYEVKTEAGLFNDPAYTNFDLEKSSGWGGKWFNFAKEGEDSFLNFDASAYDYVWIKFSGNTGNFRFGITYAEWKETQSWGECYFDDYAKDTDKPEGIAYIALEKTKTLEFGINKVDNDYKGDTWDKHIRQLFTQDNGEEVSVKIEGVWFGTTAELEAVLSGGEPEPAPTPAPAGDVAAYALNVDNALGLDADNGSTLTAGTELYSGEEGVLTIGADDTYKPNEVEFNAGADLKGGLQGGTNPKDEDAGIPDKTLKAPVSGAFFVWEAKQNGFLYAISKVSSHKSYTVFEEGTAIGYKFGAQGDAETKLGATYQFELKGEGEYNERKEAIEWAEQEYLKVADPDFYASNWEDKTADDGTVSKSWIKIGKDGLGVIVFPVVKDCKYIFNACGSKLRLGGIAFSAADDLTIKTTDGVTVYTGGGETAIQGAKVVTVNANGAIYNLAGQKVGASYKGIVIKDGKKFIQK